MFAVGTLYSSGCMEARTSLRMLPRFRLGDRRSDWNLNTAGMKLPCPVSNRVNTAGTLRAGAPPTLSKNAYGQIAGSRWEYVNGLPRRRTKFLDSASQTRRGVSRLRFRPDLVIAQRPHEHFLIYRLPGIVEHRRDAWRPADIRAFPGNDDQ